jgi:predicted membrane-bound spermidine synthase
LDIASRVLSAGRKFLPVASALQSTDTEKIIMKTPIALKYYLVISFLEGGVVMACELLGAKMIAPFYGTTLYVWSSVIGVTLLALAAGYFTGGFLVDSHPTNTLLFTVLAVGAGCVGLMPTSAKWIMNATLGSGVRTGSLVSCLVFLLPPLVCMGMVSPIIIQLGSKDLRHTGRIAGLVYAISTLGGILVTLATGFYIIPTWGVTTPTIVAAGVLGVFPLVYFLSMMRVLPFLLIIGGGVVLYLLAPEKSFSPSQTGPRILYHSTGLLGQIVVADLPRQMKEAVIDRRMLLVNRIAQTSMHKPTGYSLWYYVHAIATLASMKPQGSRALVVGLGGGGIAEEFVRLGFEVDACEFDERIPEVARKYFGLGEKVRVTVDDARHYIRTERTNYDVIAFDAFVGEYQPSHLLTQENFEEVKKILNANGLLLVNFPGFLTGQFGLATRSILHTLLEAGLDARLLPTPGSESERTIIFVASPTQLDFSGLSPERQNACCRDLAGISTNFAFLSPGDIDLQDAEVLTDDRPQLEVINLLANERWREDVIEVYDKDLRALPMF